jgi:ABC-type Fe3+/spermidine/putrescine transport system ATPase subunit
MNAGKIEQIGDPWSIYHRPENRFVAGFIGLTTFFSGKIVERLDEVVCKGYFEQLGFINGFLGSKGEVEEGTEVTLSIRPEAIDIVRGEGQGYDTNVVGATVKQRIFTGNLIDYRLDVNGVELRVEELVKAGNQSHILDTDDNVKVWLRPDRCCFILR